MLTQIEYVKKSIEINLFFLRILKEHLIFMSASLMPRDAEMIDSFMKSKEQFEELLIEAISLADGLSPQLSSSEEIITRYTYDAEIVTRRLTGLPINTEITIMAARLINNPVETGKAADVQAVNFLNRRIISLLKSTIQTQKKILQNVLSCKMFTAIYPLMVEHVTREAEHYLEHLEKLQRGENPEDGLTETAKHEVFWNEIMGDHARFIRGLLDPTEDELIRKANGFADEFDELTIAAKQALDQLEQLPQVRQKSLAATSEISEFKDQGTQGILECKIRSIILPLLSDHVLREANHYLQTLRMLKL